jgi:hypothetical protein
LVLVFVAHDMIRLHQMACRIGGGVMERGRDPFRDRGALGARYFVTTRWNDLKRETPDAAAVLEMCQDLLIADAPPDTRLIDLRVRK